MHAPAPMIAVCLSTLALSGCSIWSRTPQASFSGVTARDVREITLLIETRPDILKPLVRVHRKSADRVEVVSGRDSQVGDTSDRFIVAQRSGRWAVVSPIERDSIVVTSH